MISTPDFPTIVTCNGVSKCFCSYPRPADRLWDGLKSFSARWFDIHRPHRKTEFWALQDITFHVGKGETVGIIGRNGSGKSTLLQIIAGTLNPSQGEIEVVGRVSALLELGVGFNPDFTGVENIQMSATLLGVTPAELEERFDSILAFAEIGDHIAMPVKTYSSGMYVRLAFSVMIHSAPELLIVDEALAVGDAVFQAKCMLWLRNFQKAGGSLLFVSHDVTAVRALCDRAIYLERGQCKEMGDTGTVTDHYLRDMHHSSNSLVKPASASQNLLQPSPPMPSTAPEADFKERSHLFIEMWGGNRQGQGDARIQLVEMLDNQEKPLEVVAFDTEVLVRIYVECFKACSVSVNYKIRDKNMVAVVGADFLIAGQALLSMVEGRIYKVEYRTRLALGSGDYTMRLSITQPIEKHAQALFVDIIEVALPFKVLPSPLGWIYTQAYLPNTLAVSQFTAGI